MNYPSSSYTRRWSPLKNDSVEFSLSNPHFPYAYHLSYSPVSHTNPFCPKDFILSSGGPGARSKLLDYNDTLVSGSPHSKGGGLVTSSFPFGVLDSKNEL